MKRKDGKSTSTKHSMQLDVDQNLYKAIHNKEFLRSILHQNRQFNLSAMNQPATAEQTNSLHQPSIISTSVSYKPTTCQKFEVKKYSIQETLIGAQESAQANSSMSLLPSQKQANDKLAMKLEQKGKIASQKNLIKIQKNSENNNYFMHIEEQLTSIDKKEDPVLSASPF